MTIDQIREELQQRVIDHSEAMAVLEESGDSDYDYYQGLVEGYECVLVMLDQLDKEQ